MYLANIRFIVATFSIMVLFTDAISSDAETSSQVDLGDFSIDTTEVTIGQMMQHAKPKDKYTKAEKTGGGYEYAAGWQQRDGWYWHSPYGEAGLLDEPVAHITWFEARDYCQARNGRLPGYDEWQHAAYTELRDEPSDGYTKGKTYAYPVGSEPDGMNTSANDPWPRHAPAGVTRRGVNGLFDMGANLWEWMADEQGDRALTAGGSWWYGAQKTRVEGAQYKQKDFAAVYIGFRCVYSASN